jgi:hypothetical protein
MKKSVKLYFSFDEICGYKKIVIHVIDNYEILSFLFLNSWSMADSTRKHCPDEV